MSISSCGLIIFSLLLISSSLVIPKNDGSSKRVHENKLSDEEHYSENELHNIDYDHEAFLGEKEAKRFDQLTPEESKLRLGKIVDKIDSDKDGFVTKQELKDWIQLAQVRYIEEDSERQWNGLVQKDEKELTWKNYKKLTYGYPEMDDEDKYNQKEMMDRDLRRWDKADVDHSGSLNRQEFTHFIHPEESEHMKDLVVIETIEDIDKDKDGKISMEEYTGDMYEDDMEEEPSWLENERVQFKEFRDKDQSGYMEFDEVKHWILPDDYEGSEAEAKHLIYECDVDRDNQLSKEEILNKYDLFVGSQATDYGEALERHDEF